MSYSILEIGQMKSKIFGKINYEFELADTDEQVNKLIKKYDIVLEENPMSITPKTAKILVLGALSGKVDKYILASKKLGINQNNLEFISDYSKLKRFDVSNLEYSNKYSDIIYGPNPHKQVNLGDNSSTLAMMKKNPSKYPRVLEAIANKQLKLSIQSFKDCLEKTRLYENKYMN